jgi:hypothetical protein
MTCPHTKLGEDPGRVDDQEDAGEGREILGVFIAGGCHVMCWHLA